jgi:hypothetical protein
VARPTGIEPATPGLEGRCSIRLSYGRVIRTLVPPYAQAPTALHLSRSTHSAPDLAGLRRYPQISLQTASHSTRKMVGVEGFEPTTPCSQSRCATRLRYTPPESAYTGRPGAPENPRILRPVPQRVNCACVPRPRRRTRITRAPPTTAVARVHPKNKKGAEAPFLRVWRARRDSNSRPPSS